MIALIAFAGVSLAAGLSLARFWRGPTPYDRLLMGHALWSAAALIVAGGGALAHAHAALDAALAIVLFDAVLVVAAVKALRRNSFQPALAALDEGAAP